MTLNGKLNSEALSLLLRFHGDHELSSSEYMFNQECEELVEGGYLEKTFDNGIAKRFRITHAGFAKTSFALGTVNK